ncbi:MAG: TIGR02147 family protein [Fibrobacterales bacterium]
MNNSKPDIFTYFNFRELLKDLYSYFNKQDKSFNKSYVCKLLGLPNSRSYFTDILNGKLVSPPKIDLFSKVFRLNKLESNYFRLLINYNQTFDFSEKEFYFNQLISQCKTPQTVLDKNQYQYYQNWHHSVVRTVLNTVDISSNFKDLIDKLTIPISLKQIKDSIKLLSQLGLIEKNNHGFYKPSAPFISNGSTIENETIKQYQLKLLDISKQLALTNKTQPQKVLTKMVSISQEGYDKIAERIESFNKEIDTIIANDSKPEDRVYQCLLTMLPYSKGETHD